MCTCRCEKMPHCDRSAPVEINDRYRSSDMIWYGLHSLLPMCLVVPFNRAPDPLFERNLGLVTKKLVGLVHISTSVWHITRLVRHDIDDRRLGGVLLDEVDEILQRCAGPLPEVENFVLVSAVDGPHDTVHDVRNVRVVAGGGTIAELLNLDTAADAIDELERSHVWASTWTIHGEETEGRDVEVVEMVVGVSEKFTSFFGCGVWRDRVVDVLGFGEKRGFGTAVDRGRRREDKVLDTIFVRKFHQVGRPLYVGVDVNVRILNGRSHPGSRGHVTNPFWSLLIEKILHELLVANVTLVNGETRSVRVKASEVVKIRLLDVDIVVVVNFVDDDDIIAACQEEFCDVATDESRSSGDQNLLVTDVRGDGGFGFLGKVAEAEGARRAIHALVAGLGTRGRSIRAVVVAGTQHGHGVGVLDSLHCDVFVKITS